MLDHRVSLICAILAPAYRLTPQAADRPPLGRGPRGRAGGTERPAPPRGYSPRGRS